MRLPSNVNQDERTNYTGSQINVIIEFVNVTMVAKSSGQLAAGTDS
jgi:hypothetical protein